MTEAQLYEKVGRLQTALDESRANYDRLLRVFAEVLQVSRPTADADAPGTCSPLRVLINLTDGTYAWSAPGTRPGTPATINGLPVVVLAPEPPPPPPPPSGAAVLDLQRQVLE